MHCSDTAATTTGCRGPVAVPHCAAACCHVAAPSAVCFLLLSVCACCTSRRLNVSALLFAMLGLALLLVAIFVPGLIQQKVSSIAPGSGCQPQRHALSRCSAWQSDRCLRRHHANSLQLFPSSQWLSALTDGHRCVHCVRCCDCDCLSVCSLTTASSRS